MTIDIVVVLAYLCQKTQHKIYDKLYCVIELCATNVVDALTSLYKSECAFWTNANIRIYCINIV